MSLLQVCGLQAFYGKSQVLRGVDLTVEKGEIVALLGRNGAGRSTLAKALMGLVATRGEVLWQDQPIQGKAPYEIARLGLGYVPEGREVFTTLTVEQNLLLGHKPGFVLGSKKTGWSLDDSYAMAPVLKTRRHTLAEVLPTPTTTEGEWQKINTRRQLATAFSRLRPEEYDILTLRDVEERPYTEIAEMLSINLSAAKMRAKRAREALKLNLYQVAGSEFAV